MISENSPNTTPPTEVSANPKRRSFTIEYKLKILREADTCTPQQRGALVRREGLYSSHLTCWRRERDRGDLTGERRPRGPIPVPVDPRDLRIAELEKESMRLLKRLVRAEAMVELQKKVTTLLASLQTEMDVKS
jgi:transposase-like protein